MLRISSIIVVLGTVLVVSHGFHMVPPNKHHRMQSIRTTTTTTTTQLSMGLDLVTYLRTEFVSAALCTNQTPRAANVCLQLGVEDGRAITFVPRTIRRFVTSTSETNGVLPVSTKRQLRQQLERRGTDCEIAYLDQASDDLRDTADDSVDVVISLQAAGTMLDNGLNWKKSVREAARVLKPGGRLLFVEQTRLDGESYVEYVRNLGVLINSNNTSSSSSSSNTESDEPEAVRIFEDVGTDEVDLVLIPHIAGIAIKAEDANLSKKERNEKAKEEEQSKYAELAISAFERGRKKRKRKKKTNKGSDIANTTNQ